MNSNANPYPEFDLAADLARRDLYLFISIAATPPGDPACRAIEDAKFRGIVGEAIAWIREDSAFHPSSLGPAEIHPSLLAPEFLLETHGSLADDYVTLFGHGISKDCPPYEIEYCANRDITYRSQQMADVAGFYRGFGLERSVEAHERVDHVSLETEFMAVLITRTMHAACEVHGDEQFHVCRDAQRNFFRDHLGWWLPIFGMVLAQHAGTGFYSAMGNFLRAFVPAERAILDLPPFAESAAPNPGSDCQNDTLPADTNADFCQLCNHPPPINPQ